MTETPATISAAASSTIRKLISTLPVQFLVLVLMNILFLGGVLWFVDSETSQKLALMKEVVDHCLK